MVIILNERGYKVAKRKAYTQYVTYCFLRIVPKNKPFFYELSLFSSHSFRVMPVSRAKVR